MQRYITLCTVLYALLAYAGTAHGIEVTVEIDATFMARITTTRPDSCAPFFPQQVASGPKPTKWSTAPFLLTGYGVQMYGYHKHLAMLDGRLYPAGPGAQPCQITKVNVAIGEGTPAGSPLELALMDPIVAADGGIYIFSQRGALSIFKELGPYQKCTVGSSGQSCQIRVEPGDGGGVVLRLEDADKIEGSVLLHFSKHKIRVAVQKCEFEGGHLIKGARDGVIWLQRNASACFDIIARQSGSIVVLQARGSDARMHAELPDAQEGFDPSAPEALPMVPDPAGTLRLEFEDVDDEDTEESLGLKIKLLTPVPGNVSGRVQWQILGGVASGNKLRHLGEISAQIVEPPSAAIVAVHHADAAMEEAFGGAVESDEKGSIAAAVSDFDNVHTWNGVRIAIPVELQGAKVTFLRARAEQKIGVVKAGPRAAVWGAREADAAEQAARKAETDAATKKEAAARAAEKARSARAAANVAVAAAQASGGADAARAKAEADARAADTAAHEAEARATLAV